MGYHERHVTGGMVRVECYEWDVTGALKSIFSISAPGISLSYGACING